MIRPTAAALAAALLAAVPPLPAPSGAGLFGAAPAAAQAAAQPVGPSGLPLPRFVSLKSSRINVRRGPGQNYDIAFIFVRAGLPVEVIQEFDNWRKIRDSEGAEGWIFHSLLSGRRTAIVSPWANEGQFPVHAEASGSARIVAYLEPGVIADVRICEDDWCEVTGENFDGWIEQDRLWGVYPGEKFEE